MKIKNQQRYLVTLEEEDLDISKQLDTQIVNLPFYFQTQAETSLIHRGISQSDHATPLQLRKEEEKCAFE